MPIPDRKRKPTVMEHLEWMESDDGSLTLWDCRLDESFHGGCGAVTESLFVYLINGGVLDRLMAGRTTRVFEVGLGTATNLLLTAALAELCQTQLVYTAVEPYLLQRDVLNGLELSRRLQDPRVKELSVASDARAEVVFSSDYDAALERVTCQLIQQYSSQWSIATDLQLSDFVHLAVWPNRLERLLASDTQLFDESHDCIYFDAFSPKNSPELWTPPVFHAMRKTLAADGRLVTYCVKGSVRRELEGVGFAVEKIPGPRGGKREVLRAR